MAKGRELHDQRMGALNALGKDLARRAKSRCELTGASGVPLRAYEVPPVSSEPDIGRTILVSDDALAAIKRPQSMKAHDWRCLAEIIWCDIPAVQVTAWRLLNHLATRESWARDALDGVFLDPETEEWARDTRE